jgi:hypothetical protein
VLAVVLEAFAALLFVFECMLFVDTETGFVVVVVVVVVDVAAVT